VVLSGTDPLVCCAISSKPATTRRSAYIKDIAATGVGIAMLAWLLVLGFEAGEMLRKLP
jgi:hypothetical protein